MAGCHSSEREVAVQISPTTGYTFTSPAGIAIVLETAELELEALDLLAPDNTSAWLAPFAGSTAWAHGADAGGSVGMLSQVGVVALDAPRELGRLDVAADGLVGVDLALGTGTRFGGTIGGVAFEFQLEDAATVQATGSADSEGLVEILVDLPAIFADLSIDDENVDGTLDHADTVFSNTVSFGVVSSRTYALRTPDPMRSEVLAIEGDSTAGGQAYVDACSSCHGADGEGGVGPALQAHVAGRHRADTLDTVLNGRGTMNAVQGLEAVTLADCVAYLHYRDW